MSYLRLKTLALLSLDLLLVHSLALPGFSERAAAPQLPFTKLVAFGDQYSDDGNGSYAHGLDPGNLFKRGTWTDGPVAVTYLAQLMNVPYMSYAFGGANGNGLAGSTLDNNYTLPAVQYQPNGRGPPTWVPSITQQINNNYTLNGAPSDINSTLHFIWAGQNDMRAHTNVQNPKLAASTSPTNLNFYGNLTYYLTTQAESLIKQGSPAVVVVNFFPFQRVPANNYLWCKGNAACTNRWAKLIETANQHLEAGLAASPYADKIIYYDINTFWNHVMNAQNSYGYTQPINDFCNGNSSEPEWSWPTCSQPPLWTNARPFFWFTLCQPETSMHQFIAQDILNTVTEFVQQK